MKKNSKLYTLTSNEFEMPHYVDLQHKVHTRKANDIPMMSWPDGSWCLPANIYILNLYEKGLSRLNEGGTIKSYATNISHLLRYVYYNKIEINELTDNEFCLFITMLQGERNQNNPEAFVRDANAVIAIGTNCLDFLHTVGKLYHNPNLIGPDGQIRAFEKQIEIKQEAVNKGPTKVYRNYWSHRSFPSPDPKKKRLPISSINIEKLRQIILPTSSSIFLRKRRYVMLKLLEITGGRRSEVASLTCN
ncbi:MAG: tyrosine-type recombinase/integrase, partial [Methylophilus sp.]